MNWRLEKFEGEQEAKKEKKMSQKVLTSLKDENKDLQKHFGCISGFFQLFDHHRFLSSNGHNNIPTQGGTSNDIKELNNTKQKAKAKNAKVARENQQSSTESSSGTSMSSSCSSSMSSLEFNRTMQLEQPPSITQIKAQEKSNSDEEMKQLPNQRHHSLDFHHIVKDSMHRDAQVLSVNTVAKVEKKGRTLKRIDSPRPASLQAAAQSVDARIMVAWDSPRLSYDGRDTQSTFKSSTKHKELPRLSLDSREKSFKTFNEGTKSQNLLKGPQKLYGVSNTILKQETPKRPSSVVAKLMGLETFPDWPQTCDSFTSKKTETFAGSSMYDEYIQQQQSSASPRTFRKDVSITNMMPYSRFSLEQTPRRQADASQGSELQASKRSDASTKAPNRSLSVYGEIEKRMADLEFTKSGKDLRALKQILEAMHRYKESLDIIRDQASNSPSDNRSNSSLSESLNAESPRMKQKDSTSNQGRKSPIVIMKPAKVGRKTNTPASTEMSIHAKSAKGSPAIKHVKDPIIQPFHSLDKSNKVRTSKLLQSSKVTHVINSSNIVETRSPRLQKKFGFEKHSPPSSPSSVSSSNRRKQNRQLMEKRNGGFSEMSYQRRDFKQEVDAVDQTDFDGKRSIDSHSDIEVIHTDHFENISRNPIIQLKGLNENNVGKDLSKESFMAETIVTAEQPSPVSVLDAAIYREDPPSPVKRKSDISRDLDEVLSTFDVSEENMEYLHISSNTQVNFSNGTGDTDLKTNNLVQFLQQNDCSEERYSIFSEHKDPDHKYISEILLASGLLSSPTPSQAIHSSRYPINPMLFLALEQIKTSKIHFNIEYGVKKVDIMNNHEQMQRKLIFDVVNEILVQKLSLESSYQSYQPEGQQLLDLLCTQIDELQHKSKNVSLANEDENVTNLLWEDLMDHPTVSMECYNEIPNVVLDIERLIFKDLITEVVGCEIANHSGKYSRKLQLPSSNSS